MKKEALSTTTVVQDILCDICGDSVIPVARMKHSEHFNNFTEYAQLIASFGYGSKRDGVNINLDFCENCFDQLLAKIEVLKTVVLNRR